MDMNQLVEMQQSLTFLGSIGGLALALLGAGLAAVLSQHRRPGPGSAGGGPGGGAQRHRLGQGHRHRR